MALTRPAGADTVYEKLSIEMKYKKVQVAVYAGFAVACSLLVKCIPHILEMKCFRLGDASTDIISVVDLVMSVTIAACNVEIFVIGLLSSGFAVYGVMEKSW